MSPDEIKEKLEAHEEWLNRDGEKPNLREAILRGANLREANLREANLREANLRWADIRGADIRWAILRGANLREAILRGANLRVADLRGADIRGADLRGADLRGADLRGADLREANLREADIRGADLRGAEGWVPLSHTDHGYLVAASWHGNEWRIHAGCRDFTIAEARTHWGSPDYHTPSSGSRIIAMLDWLAAQPVPEVEK